jgi:hypothetical protein
LKYLLSSLLFLFSSVSFAQTVEAPLTKDIINKVMSSEFQFKGKGKIFGYESTESCLFLSNDIAIIKNYCLKDKNYPARSFVILSQDFGIIELYEERLYYLIKKDIRLWGFQEILKKELISGFSEASLSSMSNVIEKIYTNHLPGCWSTNFDKMLRGSESRCSKSLSVSNFEMWSEETQDIVDSEKGWDQLVDSIATKLNHK